MFAVLNGAVRRLDLPGPETPVLDHLTWGSFDNLLTPAYWKGQAWQHGYLGTYRHHRLGRSLPEEIAACLLGGFGMPAELGLAAFARVRDRGLLTAVPQFSALERALSEPFCTPHGSSRYRFPRQKARYLASCMKALQRLDLNLGDRSLRDLLTTLPGIGPKTASWIVRNHRDSDAVAIIDVHILRAGRCLGLFPSRWLPDRNYFELETKFLAFAAALGIRPSLLDALMWDYMRRFSDGRLLERER